ncbi:hypothetical protein Ancab_005851 [Ancistrocladus abbreviatus]
MEEAKCLVWVKRKHILGSCLAAAREAQAVFRGTVMARSTTHEAAGWMWPPRSYSCSFCKREFRSAQALGGHMNVHRRDRALLKQNPPNEPHHHQNHQDLLIKSYADCASPSAASVSWLPPIFSSSDHKLSMGCGLAVGLTKDWPEGMVCGGHEASSGSKKHKRSGSPVSSSVVQLFPNECGSGMFSVIRTEAGSIVEELDLELRLGDAPKVN